MKEINYSPYELTEGDEIPENILELINGKSPYTVEDLEDGIVKIVKVTSPFILADNEFDLHEANNTLVEVGVKRLRVVSFTGGALFIEFEKVSDDNCIVFGNDEEGYNIFILE